MRPSTRRPRRSAPRRPARRWASRGHRCTGGAEPPRARTEALLGASAAPGPATVERQACPGPAALRALRRSGAAAGPRHAARRGQTTCARRGRCIASSTPRTKSASGATSCGDPHYAKPELLATRAQPGLELGHHQAAGPGQVDLLLPVRDPRHLQPLRRRLDGRPPRERARSPSG